MELTREQREWLRLALIPGIGRARFIRLLARFSTPRNVLAATDQELAPIVGKAIAQRITGYADMGDLELQEAKMRERDVHLVTMDDPEYPEQLAEIYDPPVVLYVRGTLLEQDQYAVALVGTRRCSQFGAKLAYKLAYDLAERGITVVSGLAEGIDSAAHEGALAAGGRSIAVLAFGHDRVFPVSNGPLLQSIVEHGCAVSTFPMGVRALKQNFPQRNRILSGLCLGTVVVEAPPGSGSLMTAKFAAEQGREVFAVPGPAGLANSRGPHELIRDGARLVETVDDILVELLLPPEMKRSPVKDTLEGEGAFQESLLFHKAQNVKGASAVPQDTIPAAAAAPAPAPVLTKVEQDILRSLNPEGSFVDEIALTCRISISEALSTLTMLELKNAVRQLSGKRFIPQ
ncbi:MAG: DNA-protecting protein DprA [Candidatus Hydrogenedentes bacterium]|jgi:DNA processing protein|nr:DNA-protecting protein DprA [Candidatus Hydrogenedentota bacterium]